MADRGRLFYASDGLLWEVDPNADISGEPAQADLQPVRMGEMAAEVMELDQQADDGTDRVFIRGSDGAIKAEVFFDGTNTVINPLTGSVDVQGALATDQLTVAGFQGTPIWVEESGSPYTATGASSANSINPSSLDTFEQYLILVKFTDQANDVSDVDMQVGGDTGSNYFETLDDGSRNVSQTEWGPVALVASNGNTVTFRAILWREIDQPSYTSQTVSSRGGQAVAYGLNNNVSWPPGQFTLKRGVDTDWEVRVWGRDV